MNRLLTHPATIAVTTISALMAIIFLAQVADPIPKQRSNTQNTKKEMKVSVDKPDQDDIRGISNRSHNEVEKKPTLSNGAQTHNHFPG